MRRFRARIVNPSGLHARPAALFVNTAKKFQAQIHVRNVTEDSDWADAKNILGVLGLGAELGHELEFDIRGSDERQAAKTLKEALATRLGDQISPST